jgi:choline dehydrogenase-like flavoprotein
LYPDVAIPGFEEVIADDPDVDWNYTIIGTPYTNDREISLARGRILGGSASLNFLVRFFILCFIPVVRFIRVLFSHSLQMQNKGASSWWNQLAAITGDRGCTSFNSHHAHLQFFFWGRRIPKHILKNIK